MNSWLAWGLHILQDLQQCKSLQLQCYSLRTLLRALQVLLPVQPPMALHALGLREGKLSLRFSNITAGPLHSQGAQTVQVGG